MKLAETNYDNRETDCCARLDPALWDEKEFAWQDKPFMRDHVRDFLHIPLNFNSVMTRDSLAIEEASAYPEDPLWLTDEVSPWRSELYLAVDREVPGATVETLSGTFLTKTFEGPYWHAGKWADEMEEYVGAQGRDLEKIYFYYANCPKCAKRFGENRVVLFAKVS